MGKAHVGTMGWSYSFWRGNFYPEGLDADSLLIEYSKHFDTVEVDSTFYRIPKIQTVTRWKEQTPPGFLFSAKFPRVITHVKMLRDCGEEVDRFLGSISQLQDKLGPLLLQFPPKFKLEQMHRLRDFLSSLPHKYRFALEVRNRKLLDNQLYSLLKDNNIALTLVDSAFMPKVEEITANFTYVRWEGNRRTVKGTLGKAEVDRTNDVELWAEKVKQFLDLRIEVFGYFSKYYSGHPPSDASLLLTLLQL